MCDLTDYVAIQSDIAEMNLVSKSVYDQAMTSSEAYEFPVLKTLEK